MPNSRYMRFVPRKLSGEWRLLAGAALGFAVSAGLMHAFTVFFVAFLNDFGWSRADASIAYALSQLMIGMSAPLVGMGVDRFGLRRLMILGAGLLTVSLAVSAAVTSLWQLVVLYGILMTLGANCLSLVSFTPMLAKLFTRRLGLAIAIVQAASGVGRAVMTPMSQYLVQNIGWQQSYIVLAISMAVMIIPLLWLIRNDAPDEIVGLTTSEPTALASVPVGLAEPSRDWTLARATCTRHFWLLFGIYLCTGLGSFFISLHQLAFAVDMGFDALAAATALGVGSLLTIVGIITFGVLSDRLGREITGIMSYAISILGGGCALLISSPSHMWLFWLHTCLFGFTWGTRGPLITAKSAELFRGRNLGKIFGVISIGTGIGSSLGTWCSGWIFDVYGSYQLAFVLSIVSYLLGSVLFWWLRQPQTDC